MPERFGLLRASVVAISYRVRISMGIAMAIGIGIGRNHLFGMAAAAGRENKSDHTEPDTKKYDYE